MISDSASHRGFARGARLAACWLATVLTLGACGDATGPRAAGPFIRIVPVEDSVFEGDSVRLVARVFDRAGAEVRTATVTWIVADTTLATLVAGDVAVLLRPGTVRITARSGTTEASYDLVIGRLVVTRVELSPATILMGRTDRLPVAARVLGQGGRVIRGRTVSFTSDDTTVARIWPGSVDSVDTALLLAVGAGSTTIQAAVDGATGTAQIGVVALDTTFALSGYNGSDSLPVLVETDSLLVNGTPELYEIYADGGTLVLSGLLQRRFQLDLYYAVYHVIRTGDTVRRELVARIRGQFDSGLVTAAGDGTLSMLSELIGPHLEHTATLRSDGYLVHFRVPGEDAFLDLRYTRVSPG